MQNPTLLIADKTQSKELTFDELPPLLPQQQRMLSFILQGDNYTQAYRKAGYTSDEYAGRAAFILVSRNPLKAHLEYFMRQAAKEITVHWKALKLRQIIENALQTPDEEEVISRYDGELAVKAIAELNKMQGDYAASVTQVNNIHASIQDVRNAKLEYKSDK